MNRTKEYYTIKERKNFSKKIKKMKEDYFFIFKDLIEKEFKEIQLGKNITQKKKFENLIKKIQSFSQPNEFFENDQEENFIQVKNTEMVKIFKIMIFEIKTEMKKNEAIAVEIDEIFDKKKNENQTVFFKQKEREKIKQRDLSKSINELSYLVEEIGIHVDLQGEQIDNLVRIREENESLINKSYYYIDKRWRRMSKQRKIIIRFFILWLIILFIIYNIKR